MAHRLQGDYPVLRDLVFIHFHSFRWHFIRLTGNTRLTVETAVRMIARFYAHRAEDTDFLLFDADGNPCEDVGQAQTLRMRTGLIGCGRRNVWLTAVKNDPDRRSAFRAVDMYVDGEGHRLINRYPALRGFVFLYNRYLLENLKENANACLDGVADWKDACRIMNETYRTLDDSQISVTANSAPCEEEEADEICFPTGFYTDDDERRRVMIHCEKGDPGKDHPWCLHFFAAEIKEDESPENHAPASQSWVRRALSAVSGLFKGK